MRLVFPTLWSPSKTILVRLGGDEEKSAGVDGESDMSVEVWPTMALSRVLRQESDHVTPVLQNLTKLFNFKLSCTHFVMKLSDKIVAHDPSQPFYTFEFFPPRTDQVITLLIANSTK